MKTKYSYLVRKRKKKIEKIKAKWKGWDQK